MTADARTRSGLTGSQRRVGATGTQRSLRRASARDFGPYDADTRPDDVPDEPGLLDFGSVRLVVPDGGDVTVEPTANGRLQAIHVALPGGWLSISALAAPGAGDLWSELSAEIQSSLRDGGARVRSFTGDWGRELHASTGAATSVFVGVDGERWMLYGVATGPDQHAADLDRALRAMLRSSVVARGTSPFPVRTVLPLTLPPELADGAVEGAPTSVPGPRRDRPRDERADDHRADDHRDDVVRAARPRRPDPEEPSRAARVSSLPAEYLPAGPPVPVRSAPVPVRTDRGPVPAPSPIAPSPPALSPSAPRPASPLDAPRDPRTAPVAGPALAAVWRPDPPPSPDPAPPLWAGGQDMGGSGRSAAYDGGFGGDFRGDFRDDTPRDEPSAPDDAMTEWWPLPSRPEPARFEPARFEPARPEPARFEPAWPEPIAFDPAPRLAPADDPGWSATPLHDEILNRDRSAPPPPEVPPVSRGRRRADNVDQHRRADDTLDLAALARSRSGHRRSRLDGAPPERPGPTREFWGEFAWEREQDPPRPARHDAPDPAPPGRRPPPDDERASRSRRRAAAEPPPRRRRAAPDREDDDRRRDRPAAGRYREERYEPRDRWEPDAVDRYPDDLPRRHVDSYPDDRYDRHRADPYVENRYPEDRYPDDRYRDDDRYRNGRYAEDRYPGADPDDDALGRHRRPR